MPSTRLNAVARLYGYGLPHSHSSSTLEEEEEEDGGGGGGINISSLPSSSPRTRLAQKQKAMLQASQIQEELLASVNAIKGPRNQTNFCMSSSTRSALALALASFALSRSAKNVHPTASCMRCSFHVLRCRVTVRLQNLIDLYACKKLTYKPKSSILKPFHPPQVETNCLKMTGTTCASFCNLHYFFPL